MHKKWIGIFAAVAAAAILAAGPAFAQGLKVAVIDVNKVLNESEAGKVARKKMEDRYEELKKRIDALSEEAKKMKEELDKQKILLSKEKLKAKEEALGVKVAELRNVSQESEKEMQSRQRDLTRDVLKIVEGQVDKIVQEEKIDLLLERSSGVVHFDPSLDITAKVLALVNKEKPGGK
ncbi:MAG: OmpH family outer membrane protein [Deltaproteobacteria bacterium]|nr:OmpH family outer membrane protein [Deltaproteobacteria bacterium]